MGLDENACGSTPSVDSEKRGWGGGTLIRWPRLWEACGSCSLGLAVSDQPTGTSHSNPYHYDTNVPFAIVGASISPQRIRASVHITDLAPTLAALVGMHWHTDEKESNSRAELIQRTRSVEASAGDTGQQSAVLRSQPPAQSACEKRTN